MFTFGRDAWSALHAGGAPTVFMAFFAYVWTVWAAKAVLARRYAPVATPPEPLRSTVIVPVFRELPELLARVLASVAANRPAELIVVVDGGDDELTTLARAHCDRVVPIPRAGKRGAIEAGLCAADASSEVVVVVDSDTIWTADTLSELLRPFADPRVGGVTPRQVVFDAQAGSVRRLAAWIEDIRYHLPVPAQSAFGQVGCLAGRTIAYRRSAFEPAVRELVGQQVLGVPLHVGDDRVLTNVLLRDGWRTVYQSTSVVETDAPSTWREFVRQQLRWARSSQRETVLSLPWLWRRPVACLTFATDIITPFAFFAVASVAVAHALRGAHGVTGLPLAAELALGYAGMLASIGVRQTGHLRRVPADLTALPVFVLQVTFLLVPIRIAGFATMFHQGWGTRSAGGAVAQEPRDPAQARR